MPTIAVMAGGVDRFYPSGNEDLLRAVANQGAVLAEVPPGSAPTRYRFLQRNRLIAALASVTVVVEARWRSGALNTAHHAETLGRAVGRRARVRPQRQLGRLPPAAPGRRRRLRHGRGGDRRARLAQRRVPARDQDGGRRQVHDGLTLEDLILLDALPLRSTSSVEKLCAVAGLGAGIGARRTGQAGAAGPGRVSATAAGSGPEGGLNGCGARARRTAAARRRAP